MYRLQQLLVCIGTEGTIFDEPLNSKILVLLWDIAELHGAMWSYDGHTFENLLSLDDRLVAMLERFKEIFMCVSKSDCRFMKFHLTLHLPYTIHEWGSMRTVDTAFGEGGNKGVKKLYRATNRRSERQTEQMYDAASTKYAVTQAAASRGLVQSTIRRPRATDTLRGRGWSLNLTTGARTPHLTLPSGVAEGLVEEIGGIIDQHRLINARATLYTGT